MSWNYRIIFHDIAPESWFGLHEVYYSADGSIKSWTEEPISFGVDSDEGLGGIHDALMRAIHDVERHPILNESELEKSIR